MAKLTNSLNGGKVTRVNDMFDNRSRPATVGYAHMRCSNPEYSSGMRLELAATDHGDRNYALLLDPLDVQRIINRLLNPNYNMGFFGSNTYSPSERSDYHYEQLLEDNGIKLATYRYPTTPFATGTKRWFWVRAVNLYHAEHQLSRVIKSFDPALVEVYDEDI